MAFCCGSKKKHQKSKMAKSQILINKFRFSPSELLIYKQKFDRIAPGFTFSKEEFTKNMSMIGIKDVSSIPEQIFSLMNTSQTGQVSLEEYLAYMDILINGTLEEKAEQSFKIIAGFEKEKISFNSFTFWLISVWKMINNNYEDQVLINKEEIKSYFDELDSKKDGKIDYEEYLAAIKKNENLLEWFSSLNLAITERLNAPCIEDGKKEEKNYLEKISLIESQIQSLIFLIDQESGNNHISLSSNPEMKISFRHSDRKFSSHRFEKNNESEEHSRRQSHLLTFRNSKETNRIFNPKIEMVKNRLCRLLGRLTELKEKGGNDEPENFLQRTWSKSNPRKPLALKKNAIYWGDQDWNLILNMMLGIQKSVKSTIADTEILKEITPDMFVQKVKHDLHPSHSKSDKLFKFWDFAPIIFERIRKFYGIKSGDYIRSLGIEKMMHALMANEFSSLIGQCTTGKSGSFFYYSDDGKYMLKTLSLEEYQFFKTFLQNYYNHLYKNPHTLITRFFGFHKIIVCSTNKKLYFVVMGNLFKADYDLDIKYDLKGSSLGRFTNSDEDKTIARKDNNFNQDKRKIRIGNQKKGYLMEQITKDCNLMMNSEIIDYSLLLGICSVNRKKIPKNNSHFTTFAEVDDGGMLNEDHSELYFLGVIDILTHYGTRKKLEHFFKTTVNKKEAVSCAPPEFYAQRFIKYIDSIIE